MIPDTPASEVIKYCKRRYGHSALFQSVMLDSVENLLQGKRAPFLEKPDCRDLAEEVLWICFTKKAVLASPLQR
ncbi:hypothetical protein A3D71_03380 [Candidatus Kaiserbacteria bacterium RIFCSPHIGHO2_02_FULL_55_20]|uniref:Uncharacterized protein n=1 Tax=Candidatus Kaiserbacteria bacterium RIFCSPHIGHO2_02_FULL_55_20 TaxID=1798497 RepID=A0A1F6DXF2_9BACT|nr:MAG: hypothetical protein A2680_03265 [Candidatus Kaiserbacteria bacterium RIFCSPHIGHO2_01_FULL_55_37]OGG66105.1 MAG: hypothetical protein A3D71_03380 [Candidatus Kaiserbacteria bacterium RIFCSPHIGHO2_02_FULL_55_20]